MIKEITQLDADKMIERAKHFNHNTSFLMWSFSSGLMVASAFALLIIFRDWLKSQNVVGADEVYLYTILSFFALSFVLTSLVGKRIDEATRDANMLCKIYKEVLDKNKNIK